MNLTFTVGSVLHQLLSSPQRADTPLRVANLVRTAKKYHLDDIVGAVIAHMEKEWPVTLAAWDDPQNGLESKLNQDTLDGKRYQVVENRFPEPVSSILFAQENDITTILPAAFYQLSMTRVACDWDMARQDHNLRYVLEPSARWALFDKDNLLRLFRGREKLHAAFLEHIRSLQSRLTGDPSQFCGDCDGQGGMLESCPDGLFRLGELLGGFVMITMKSEAWDNVDVLGVMRKLKEHIQEVDMCSACTSSYEGALDKARSDMWKRIPQFFEYPNLEAPR